jgi:hypothetical protein
MNNYGYTIFISTILILTCLIIFTDTGNDIILTQPKKAVVAYTGSFTNDEITYITTHFNLIILNPDLIGIADGVQRVKESDSSVVTLAYRESHMMYEGYDDWAVVDANEDWFLHTAGAQRIQNTDHGWWLMDAGSAGWRQHLVDHAEATYLDTPYYDGLFADDVHDELPNFWNLSGEVQAADIASWHADVTGLLSYIQTNLDPSKLFFINSSQYGEYDYAAYVDGVMIEDYAHPNWLADASHNADYFVMQKVADLNYLTGTLGKTVIVNTGTTSAVTDAMVTYNLAAFFLGDNSGLGYFSFNNWADPAHGYYSLMDTDIGSASSGYVATQNIYERDFSGGKVVFNPSTIAYSNISLSGTYLLDGAAVSFVDLSAHDAEIMALTTSLFSTLLAGLAKRSYGKTWIDYRYCEPGLADETLLDKVFVKLKK